MKRNYLLLLFILACIALLSGSLTAGMSFVGHIGIGFLYEQLSFFKTWWQSALVCFSVMAGVLILLYIIDRVLSRIIRKVVMLLFFFLFLAGLYFTFQDFRTDLAHRWMGERFHVGIYLYWIGGCVISLFFMFTESKKLRNNNAPDGTVD